MNFQKLEYFVAIAEHLSFSEAAKSLYLTQPSLSRQIADLEEEIGMRLLSRTKRSVSLTAEGEIFLQEAKEIMNRRDSLLQRINHIKQGAYGQLNVGYWEIVDYDLMTESIRRTLEKCPALDIMPIKNNFGPLLHELRSGNLDLVYTANVKLDNVAGILWTKMAESKYQVVVPKNHRLADRKKIKLSEIANEKIIKMARSESPITTDYIIQLCNKNGFSPNIISQPSDLESSLILVAACRGVAILSSRMKMKVPLSNLVYIDIDDPGADLSVDLVWRKDDSNPMVTLFTEMAISVAREFSPHINFDKIDSDDL